MNCFEQSPTGSARWICYDDDTTEYNLFGNPMAVTALAIFLNDKSASDITSTCLLDKPSRRKEQ